jgi:hypothetical protein
MLYSHLQAVVSLMTTVYSSEIAADVLSERDACIIVQALMLECLEDYTTDKRGDVGSQCASIFNAPHLLHFSDGLSDVMLLAVCGRRL